MAGDDRRCENLSPAERPLLLNGLQFSPEMPDMFTTLSAREVWVVDRGVNALDRHCDSERVGFISGISGDMPNLLEIKDFSAGDAFFYLRLSPAISGAGRVSFPISL